MPWPQKGDSVDLPLGSTAPVAWDGTTDATVPSGGGVGIYSTVSADYIRQVTNVTNNVVTGDDGDPPNFDENNSLYADLTSATAATINQLRQAFQIQRLLEKDARGGTRYTEIVRAHFGVISPDARLQRPEYLGGGRSPVGISQVPQTSATDAAVTPQGNLAAFGTVTSRSNGFSKSFTEHCLLIGLMCVDADLTYQQGLNRMWSRQTRYDFYWPSLSHIGEQAVLNKEIYTQGTAGGTDDDAVFGYQERYAEYRYKPSEITGKFRSTYSTTLDYWHLSQEFSSLPTLGPDFITSQPPVDRVIAVPSEPHFICDLYFKLRTARPMPVYGVPGLIDHF